MSVKLRLTRAGGKKQPFYRIIATDSRMSRDGRFIEIIGHYNPRTEPSTVVVDAEKAKIWLSRGARPSPVVEKILAIAGIIKIEKKIKKPGKRTIAARIEAKKAAEKKEAEEKTAPTAEATATASAEGTAEARDVVEQTAESAETPAEEAVLVEGPTEEAPVEAELPAEEAVPSTDEAVLETPAEEAPLAVEDAVIETEQSDESPQTAVEDSASGPAEGVEENAAEAPDENGATAEEGVDTEKDVQG